MSWFAKCVVCDASLLKKTRWFYQHDKERMGPICRACYEIKKSEPPPGHNPYDIFGNPQPWCSRWWREEPGQ